MKQYKNFSPEWTRGQLLEFGLASGVLPIAVSQVSSGVKQNLPALRTSFRVTSAAPGRLRARPTQPASTGTSGLHPLRQDGKRDGLLYVPAAYGGDKKIPLVLMLHGAGGDAKGALNILQKVAEPLEMMMLAVESRSSTWDILRGGYGPDIAFIDQALAQTFNRYAIDPSKVAIASQVSATVLPTPYPLV